MLSLSTLADKIDFLSLTRDGLAEELSSRFGQPAFRAAQLFEWVYARSICDIEQMTNISRTFRSELAPLLYFEKPVIAKRQASTDGSRKYLLQFTPGDSVETVMVAQPERMTLCVSSQVGCGMDCKFCRTAAMGLRRNLRAAEIVAQVITAKEDAAACGDMFNNIVFMGMGEPFANLKSVISAVSILTDTKGLKIPPRKITVSTSGLVPAIRKFGEAALGVNLAISLNATTNESRSRLMPINQKFPLEELLAALREYPVKRRSRVTIEYVMISGVNDTEADLKRLPGLLHGIPAKVNLIPYNPGAGMGFEPPPEERVQRWQKALMSRNMDVMVRWSKGSDIDAACGQLATS